MSPLKPLPPDALFKRSTLDELPFNSTTELADIEEFIGQDRAIRSVEFGIGIERQGYNIFALGPAGTGKRSLVRQYVEQRAATEPPPSDWCYVNNFDRPYIPNALRLPAGMGKQLSNDVQHLVGDLKTSLSAAFESEEYQTRRQSLEMEFQERQQESLKELQEKAREKGLALLRTPAGLAFAPLKEGNVVAPEEFEKLPLEEQERIKAEVETLQGQLQKALYQMPRWEREWRSRMRDLNLEVSGFVLKNLVDDLNQKYAEFPEVVAFIQAIQKDVNENLTDFLSAGEKGESQEADGQEADNQGAGGQAAPFMPNSSATSPTLRRYEVNVLVDSSDLKGAPVIYESNPSYLNLVGRVEQMAEMGALTTDFTLIKPGVLHRANGGYLILDALKVLSNPYAWEGLKRALQFRQIRIESPVQMLNLTSTVSLEPEPIPLDVKVVLMGDPQLYYTLSAADPEFNELFKVSADFSDDMERTSKTEHLYAQLIATIARREELCPFDKSAVARIIEQSARIAQDAERLTARLQTMVDLMEEANYWAVQAKAPIVTAHHVQQALEAQIYRSDRVSERMREEILRKTILIDTQGEQVGQINGLSVIQLGNFMFGQPSRITANIRMGNGDVVNIEREVELSGPLHSKGVLILTSYLSTRYATDQPLSFAASLVFEQSYGGVDGDSASSTELYALLSALAEAPIKQSLAVTGSLSQHGQVQAIGGVNEKIEGFFDLCKARGLTGEQGVMIPAANVKHLMLRQEIVETAAAGKFQIYPIETIDQGIEVLTGIPAGVRGKNGDYPKGTINQRVEARLQTLARKSAAIEKKKSRKKGASKKETGKTGEGEKS